MLQQADPSISHPAPAWSRWRGLPVLVALLGIALSIAGWLYLVMDRRDQVRETAAQVAAQSRKTVETSVRSSLAGLHDLAGFWATMAPTPVDEWRAQAELLIESRPALRQITWVRPGAGRPRVAVGRFERPEPAAAERVEPTEAVREPQLLGPETGATGAQTLHALLPVRRSGDPGPGLGYLEARIDLEELLATALEESAPGYAIRIYWGDQLLYARGEPSADPWQRWWREEGTIQLPRGLSWRALHLPTPELAAAWLDPVPHYLLAVGILLAIALGVLSHHLRFNFLRARYLAAGNEALEASAGELRRLNEALEARVSERTRELESFTHSISHDLKSPLAAILNFTEILDLDFRDRPLDEEGRTILQRIRRSATRGNELLEGLLRLSRAGHGDLKSQSLEMERLARDCFETALQASGDEGVDFRVEPLPDAVGDRSLIREVWVNLFDNALKYSRGQEKRQILVRGRRENGACVYEVEDDGQGFDMRYAGKLFGLFQRLHGSGEIEGTGVGLALVARIVTRHGGRVEAEGRPGEGATFRFTLPSRGGPRE